MKENDYNHTDFEFSIVCMQGERAEASKGAAAGLLIPPLWSALCESSQVELAGHLKKCKFTQGQQLAKAGDEGAVHLIQKGTVTVSAARTCNLYLIQREYLTDQSNRSIGLFVAVLCSCAKPESNGFGTQT